MLVGARTAASLVACFFVHVIEFLMSLLLGVGCRWAFGAFIPLLLVLRFLFVLRRLRLGHGRRRLLLDLLLLGDLDALDDDEGLVGVVVDPLLDDGPGELHRLGGLILVNVVVVVVVMGSRLLLMVVGVRLVLGPPQPAAESPPVLGHLPEGVGEPLHGERAGGLAGEGLGRVAEVDGRLGKLVMGDLVVVLADPEGVVVAVDQV